MSTYHDMIDAVKRHKCKECSGLGYCDDLEPGDISGNTWECVECGGTGMLAVLELKIIKVNE